MLQTGETTKFEDQLYQTDLQKAVRLKGLCREDAFETQSITFRGTLYKRGMTVVVDQNDMDYKVGKIVLLLINQSYVHFVVEHYHAVAVVDLGVYC